jgi:hypothetical protein
MRTVICYAEFHNIFNGWKGYFFEPLNVNRVSDVRQMEIQLTH